MSTNEVIETRPEGGPEPSSGAPDIDGGAAFDDLVDSFEKLILEVHDRIGGPGGMPRRGATGIENTARIHTGELDRFRTTPPGHVTVQ